MVYRTRVLGLRFRAPGFRVVGFRVCVSVSRLGLGVLCGYVRFGKGNEKQERTPPCIGILHIYVANGFA